MSARDEMAADVLADRDDDLGDELADRENRHNRPQVYSARQRVIVVTFPTPAAADVWDAVGRPIDMLHNRDIKVVA